MNRSFGCITLLRCEENRCTFLTLTKGYKYTWNVCLFFEGICYFLVFFVMKLSLLHLSKFKCHHSIHHSLKRSAWGLALVINISLFLVGEQRRRENRNKTATNPGPVSRKSRGNFPGCLRRRRSKPWSACAGYNAGYFPGPESCFLIAVFTFKINVLVWKWYDETIVNEATRYSLWAGKPGLLGTVLLCTCNKLWFLNLPSGLKSFPTFRETVVLAATSNSFSDKYRR